MTTNHAQFVHRLVASLVLVSLALAGVLVPAKPAGAVRPQNVLETEILQQLNAERTARGLGAVSLEDELIDASARWSDSMASRNSLVHSGNGRAEIIAYGYTTGQITLAWMNSPSHRNLMVDPNLVFGGVGVTCDSGGRMWATIQFRRLDTRLATLGSSSPGPAVTADLSGSNCEDQAGTPPVRRLYRAFFQRESDAGGLAYWVQRYADGESLTGIADYFATSAEFQATYGQLSDRDFVKTVYVNVMGRSPDQGGYDYWVGQMRSGMTRGELMVAFSESQEFVIRTGIV